MADGVWSVPYLYSGRLAIGGHVDHEVLGRVYIGIEPKSVAHLSWKIKAEVRATIPITYAEGHLFGRYIQAFWLPNQKGISKIAGCIESRTPRSLTDHLFGQEALRRQVVLKKYTYFLRNINMQRNKLG